MEKLISALIFIFAVAIFPAYAEQVEITTYYPAPQGVYDELQSQKFYGYPLTDVYPPPSSHSWYGTDPANISYLKVLSTSDFLGVGVTDTVYLKGRLDVSNDNGRTHDLFVELVTGNVGIGLTAPLTDGKLHVYGSAGFSGNLVKLENTSNNAGRTLYLINAAGNQEPLAYFENLGRGPAAVFTGGNVGIGTTAPDARLNVSDVASAGSSLVSFHNAQGAGGGRALYLSNTVGNTDPVAFFERFDSGPAAVFVGGVNNVGMVGIGTTNPTGTLEVNGTILSPRWRVSQVLNSFNSASDYPIYSDYFDTGGGPLLIIASGTGSLGARGLIGMNIAVEGYTPVGSALIYVATVGEANTTKTFTSTVIATQIPAGQHRIVLTKYGSTIKTANDYFNVSVLEFPFNNN